MFEWWNNLADRLAPSEYGSLTHDDRQRAFNSSLTNAGLSLMGGAQSGDLSNILRALQAGKLDYQDRLAQQEEMKRKLAADDQRRQLADLQITGAKNDLATDDFNAGERGRKKGELFAGRAAQVKALEAQLADNPNMHPTLRARIQMRLDEARTSENPNQINDDLEKILEDTPEAIAERARLQSDGQNYLKTHDVDRPHQLRGFDLAEQAQQALINARGRQSSGGQLSYKDFYRLSKQRFDIESSNWNKEHELIAKTAPMTERDARLAAHQAKAPTLDGIMDQMQTSIEMNDMPGFDPSMFGGGDSGGPDIQFDSSVDRSGGADRVGMLGSMAAVSPQEKQAIATWMQTVPGDLKARSLPPTFWLQLYAKMKADPTYKFDYIRESLNKNMPQGR